MIRLAGVAVLTLALAAGAAQAQYVIVHSPPAVVYPQPVVVHSAPVVTYSAPVTYAPVTTYSAFYPPTTVYSAPTTVYSAPTTVYSAPVIPGTVTTRSYVGLGIFRPRGVYTESYFTPYR